MRRSERRAHAVVWVAVVVIAAGLVVWGWRVSRGEVAARAAEDQR